MRLVVDTNVMIRALLSPGPARRLFRLAPIAHRLVYHAEQLHELRELRELRDVASRPRLNIAPEAVEELVDRIVRYGQAVQSDLDALDACRDPNDNYVLALALALALAGTADFVVTEGADLLVLDPWNGIRIVRLHQFLSDHPLPELP